MKRPLTIRQRQVLRHYQSRFAEKHADGGREREKGKIKPITLPAVAKPRAAK